MLKKLKTYCLGMTHRPVQVGTDFSLSLYFGFNKAVLFKLKYFFREKSEQKCNDMYILSTKSHWAGFKLSCEPTPRFSLLSKTQFSKLHWGMARLFFWYSRTRYKPDIIRGLFKRICWTPTRLIDRDFRMLAVGALNYNASKDTKKIEVRPL